MNSRQESLSINGEEDLEEEMLQLSENGSEDALMVDESRSTLSDFHEDEALDMMEAYHDVEGERLKLNL